MGDRNEGSAGSLRLNFSFNSSVSPKGHLSIFNKTNGVLVRGSFRYHKGSQAKPNPGGRMKSHLIYLEGGRQEQIQSGTSENRRLFNHDGGEQTASQAFNRHRDNGIFIEHRIIISPAGHMAESELHKLAQATAKEIQSRNPDKEIRTSYSIHTDTAHSHAHLVMTSPNKLVLDRNDYHHLRELNQQIRREIELERNVENHQQDGRERVNHGDEFARDQGCEHG